MTQTILVPLDGTALGQAALRYVAQEAFARGAGFILVQAVAPVPSPRVEAVAGFVPAGAYESYEQDARDEAQRQGEALRYVTTSPPCVEAASLRAGIAGPGVSGSWYRPGLCLPPLPPA